MKVLFAVSDEAISQNIIKQYQEDYKEIITSTNKYFFNAIIKELAKDKTYDIIVISEDLEPVANNNYDQIDKFILEKLDDISDEATKANGEDVPIIFICSDRRTRNDDLLRNLFSMGIYNALVEKDRNIPEVCRLINRPRAKKEAKKYYLLDGEEATYNGGSNALVSEDQINNILNYYSQLGGAVDKYSETFDHIAQQYDDSQLRLIIKFLPENVKVVLEKSNAKYQQLVNKGTVLTNGSYSEYSKKQDDLGSIYQQDLKSQKLSNPVVIPEAMNFQTVHRQPIMPNSQQPMGQRRPVAPINQQGQQNPYGQQQRPNPYGQNPNAPRPQQPMQRPMQPGQGQPNPYGQQQRPNPYGQNPNAPRPQQPMQRPVQPGQGQPNPYGQQQRPNPYGQQNPFGQNPGAPRPQQPVQQPIQKPVQPVANPFQPSAPVQNPFDANQTSINPFDMSNTEAINNNPFGNPSEEGTQNPFDLGSAEQAAEVNNPFDLGSADQSTEQKSNDNTSNEEVIVNNDISDIEVTDTIEEIEETPVEKVETPKIEEADEVVEDDEVDVDEIEEIDNKLENIDINEDSIVTEVDDEKVVEEPVIEQPKRKRGRPKKNPVEEAPVEETPIIPEVEEKDEIAEALDKFEIPSVEEKIEEPKVEEPVIEEIVEERPEEPVLEEVVEEQPEEPALEEIIEEQSEEKSEPEVFVPTEDIQVANYSVEEETAPEISAEDLINDASYDFFGDGDDNFPSTDTFNKKKTEEPKEETIPVEEPKVEEPKVEDVKVEELKVETPTIEKIETEKPKKEIVIPTENTTFNTVEMPMNNQMQNPMVNPMDMQMNAPMMNQMDMMNMQMGDPMMMNQMDMMNMQMGDPMMMNQMDMMNMQMGYPMMDPMGMQFANFNMADYQPGEINGPHINGFEQFQGEIQPVDYSDDYAINVDMQTLDQDVPTQTGTHEVEGAGKVVAFIGTSKNGTSFLADSVGMLFSQAGIKTAIVDTTKNKNSYYMFTNNNAKLGNIAASSLKNLAKGRVEGLELNPSLSVFTGLPGDIDELYLDVDAIVNTLSMNFDVVLLDCDFSTDDKYFAKAKEFYLVQTMDAFTIQPLTRFLSELKLKGLLDENKLRIIINKYIKMKKLSYKMIIGGLSKYNEPAMTLQRDLFNPNNVPYILIPFDDETYEAYLQEVAMCDFKLNNYSDNFLNALETLKNMIFNGEGSQDKAKKSLFNKKTKNDNKTNYDKEILQGPKSGSNT